MGALHKITRRLCGEFQKSSRVARDREGRILTTAPEQADVVSIKSGRTLQKCSKLAFSSEHGGTPPAFVSDKFEVQTGVRQGFTLSPLLFLILVDYVMRIANVRSRGGIQWGISLGRMEYLDDLDHADDLAVLASLRKLPGS